MRLPAIVLAATLLVRAVAPVELPRDVFERDRVVPPGASLDRLSTDLWLGRPNAARQLEVHLRNPAIGSREDRIDAFLMLCGAYFREQRFADGLRTCSAAEEMKKASAGNMVDLHRAFQSVGPARWSKKSVRIPLKDGQSTIVRQGPIAVEAIIDTGAEIAVVSAKTARLLGAKSVGSSLEIGTTTTPVVGGMARLDGLRIGDATLSNVTAFVLPDDQASVAGLDLAIPLPVLIPFGRMAYANNGATLLLGKAAPRLGHDRTPLYWDESGVGFAVRLGGGIRGVHFDTGSKRTWLFPAARPALSASESATRRPYKRKIAGLGGERVEDAAMYRGVVMGVGRQTWRFPEIEMAEKDENGEAARIGAGLFSRFREVVLDFRRMEMSVAN